MNLARDVRSASIKGLVATKIAASPFYIQDNRVDYLNLGLPTRTVVPQALCHVIRIEKRILFGNVQTAMFSCVKVIS